MKLKAPFLIGLLLMGCVGRPPLRTYTVARTALESARKFDGNKAAPHEMHLAEESYRRGEFFFKNRDYNSAFEAFEETIKYAEQAENRARLTPKKD